MAAERKPTSAPTESWPADEGRGEAGGIAATVKRAQDAVAELSADYQNWALLDLGKAEQALAEARGDTGAAEPALQRLYGIAHDMKGQGGSFGFPLVTHVAQSLCRLLVAPGSSSRHIAPLADDATYGLIEVHLKALRLILEKSVRGEGGEVGQKLVAKLQAMAGQN
ncbi:MAG TPA: Hpt domain-containing protein [Hypericibacter adhaerens]|nr:Hpt domain-containing protein [Hypericibacter adhaerens]